ncbi:MAG: peptide chain release factor N(5)-glutamine methyltransferase [Dehalococcoidia bacterium]|nr:peptide chain release factor N(5)-glutamine methyltransferase [Dehalococcoidia bacterium]
MTVKEARYQAAKTLAAHAIEDAPLEAELLLMHVLSIDRTHLYVRLEDELLPGEEQAFYHLINRRLTREPLAYITGHREFFGHDFLVASGVLIPRQASELLVEEAIDFVKRHFPGFAEFASAGNEIIIPQESTDGNPATPQPYERNPVIAEIGTGSGAIAVSLALLLPQATVYATDISPLALEIAAINCERHNVRVHLLEGDLMDPVPEPVDIIIANLPYVRDEEWGGLSPEIKMYEPAVALAGGRDGLDIIRQLLVNIPEKLRPGGIVLLEIGPAQGPELVSWTKDLFPGAGIELAKDPGGMTRVFKVNIDSA